IKSNGPAHHQWEVQNEPPNSPSWYRLFCCNGRIRKISLAMDTSLPMKAADIDPAFEKAFNAGDLDTLLKLYDEQSVLVAEPGKPVQGSIISNRHSWATWH